MWISPAYEREYRDWIESGQFERLIAREREYLPDALNEQHPALIADSLSTLATCYHTRGTVALLERQDSGWYDIQAGYWANLYSLRFEIVTVTLPAWSQGRSFNRSTELVIALAFSRLFRQTDDQSWLEQAITEHFETGPHVVDSQPGNIMLTAMREPTIEYTREELLADRRACCTSRDAYPKRLTEIVPIGVLDLEVVLHYPADAAFTYVVDAFAPTIDNEITECIAAYHIWYT